MSDMLQLPVSNDLWTAPTLEVRTNEETGEDYHALVNERKNSVEAPALKAPGQMTPDQAAFFFAQMQQAPK